MRWGLLAALVLALALPASASAAGYASPGGNIELRMRGETVELVRGGEVVASDSAGAQWVIHGSDDADDTLTVRNPDGGVVPAYVTFAGGDGAGVDTLKVVGGRSDSAAATAAGPDSGSIEHARGSDTLSVAYSGLEPLVDTVAAANLTIDYGGGNDTITIDDGVAAADGRLRVDTPTTEEIEFANKTSVTINGNGGTDTVAIDNTETATGLTGTMTVNTGTEVGESISVDDANYTGATLMLQTAGAIVDQNSGANNVTANAFGAHAGTGIVMDTTVSNLEVDTDTGPLAIFNTGAVTVGGVSSTLHGLRVGGDSTGGNGSVDLTASAITLNDATGPEAVRSGFVGGSVSFVATGAFSTTASQPAVRAPVGSIGVSGTSFAIAAGSTFQTFFPCTFVATGTALDLGGAGAGAALSDTELDQVSAGILLVVGTSVINTAPVSIDPTRAASFGMTANTGGITQTPSAGITAQRLVVGSISGTTNLGGNNNDVDSLEGTTQSVIFSDQDGLTIPAQLRATTGALVVRANGNMTVNAPVKADAGLVDLAVLAADGTLDNNAAVTGKSAVLRSDRMALEGGSVNVGTGTLGLQPQSSAQKFDLGPATDAAVDTTELSDAELDTLTTEALQIGHQNSGPLTVSQPISPAHSSALELFADGFAGPGSVTVPTLSFNDTGSTGRAWTLDSTAVNDGPPIPYSGVTNLTVTGGSGADTFDVKASPTTTYAIIGGDPGSSPGDTLNYDDEGRGAGGDTTAPEGNITSPGVHDVSFREIERTHFEGIDPDDDGVPNSTDNCPGVANPDQADLDKDGIGNACDPHPDTDGDGVDDPVDNCVVVANAGQADQDGDKAGDACDPDLDGDGRDNAGDNCPNVANAGQRDLDHDGIGHACDSVDLAPGVCPNPLNGTPGPDTLIGTSAGDVITGGAGNDVIRGLGGDDCPIGGSGNDKLFGGSGADRIRGEGGNDLLSGGPGKDRFMRGGAGADVMLGGDGADGMAGGDGADVLAGGGGADYLSGGRGPDRITGGSGRNGLFGRSGDDRINARNGERDTVQCGSGHDRATVDAIDRVIGCEHVVRPLSRRAL